MQTQLVLLATVGLAAMAGFQVFGSAMEESVQGRAGGDARIARDPVATAENAGVELGSTQQAGTITAALKAAKQAFSKSLGSLEVRPGKFHGRPEVPQVALDQVERMLSAEGSSSRYLDSVELERARQIGVTTVIAAPDGAQVPRASVRTSFFRKQQNLTLEVPQSMIRKINAGGYKFDDNIRAELARAVALALRGIEVDPIDPTLVHLAAANIVHGGKASFPRLRTLEQDALWGALQNSKVLNTSIRSKNLTDIALGGGASDVASFSRRLNAVGDTEVWHMGFVRNSDGTIDIPDDIVIRYVLGVGRDAKETAPHNTFRIGENGMIDAPKVDPNFHR